MPRTFVFVHGHHFKPAAGALAEIWSDALRAGLERDRPEKLELYDAANKELVYFGDLNNTLLRDGGLTYDEAVDVADRRNAIARLRELNKPKKFKRYNYEQLPGKSALPEIIADVAAPLLDKLGLASSMIGKLIPELAAYWDPHGAFREQALERARRVLTGALARRDEIMLIAHGLGAVIAWDTLWEISRGAAQRSAGAPDKIHHFVSLGAPLGDETVKKHLAGWAEKGERRYPDNLLNWHNIAAEDDFQCHDKTVLDDFQSMLKHHLISVIDDYRIYNMAVRYGCSNPHSAVGYLVHPRLAKLVGDWL